MKVTLRLLAMGLLGLGLSGLPGCADNNDSDTIKDTNSGGQRAKVQENAPTTPEDQYKQYNSQPSGTAGGYNKAAGGGGGGGRK
ncbi:MAG TPA: hypothetical protein VG406_00710 [Isosphaeraceae bacterium]|jgi:hypothetical protein|nr:hypothetical protein [Isosphaeraceae bacterium]